MSFGGLAPLPMRLGPASTETVSPEQWLRLATDAAALSAPLAVLLISENIDESCSVSGIALGAGNDLSEFEFHWGTVGGDKLLVIGFPFTFTDSLGNVRSWKATSCRSTIINSPVRSVASLPNTVAFLGRTTLQIRYATSGALLEHLLVIWGTTEERAPGDYGAESNKAISEFEGDAPYAATWLQEMHNVRGDAFSVQPGSFTEMENVALARHFGMLQRLSERHAANQTPEHADQSLGRWAKILDIGTTDGKDYEIRAKAAAKYALTIAGPTEAGIAAAAQSIFGTNFTAVHRFLGTLDAPPDPTYWPGVNPGPPELDLDGSGTWCSQRFYYLIQLNAANDAERVRLLGLARRDFDELLLAAMSPVNTWGYSFNAPGGFILGTSELGRESL